ncbi:MAG: hypothetical protein CL927_01310 [Deltaproteobacteria bacterium]|nr:hypothetical protein [Deltaproteobacteria bacterium]
MPIIALSRRQFPILPRRRRVTAGGALSDSEQESAGTAEVSVAPGEDALAERQNPEQQLDALFEALNDDELAQLEELPTEDLEAYIAKLQRETGAPRRRRSLLDVAV